MLTRIRKSIEEKDSGFTLIELLVVMIIIGILAAIAIPVFLSQRNKARDTATKADVSTLGKEIATYFVDNTAAPSVAAGSTSSPGRWLVNGNDVGKISDGVGIKTNISATATASSWCISLQNSNNAGSYYKYSATGGLAAGDCP